MPMTMDEGGRLRAATAAEFKRGMSALTGGHAYAHINDYADAVRKRVWREGAEIAVAERGTCAAADPTVLTPWLGNFLSFEESDADAVRLVAAHLAATVGPQDADFLSVKTWGYRYRQGPLPSARPRLIGRKAREQEQARRLKAAEDRLAEAEKALKGAERVLRDCEASAEDLGLQLFVSSPDQDGVKREIRHSVSLIVVKDENLDVHLSPVTWNNAAVQTGLFDGEAPTLGMTVGEETK